MGQIYPLLEAKRHNFGAFIHLLKFGLALDIDVFRRVLYIGVLALLQESFLHELLVLVHLEIRELCI